MPESSTCRSRNAAADDEDDDDDDFQAPGYAGSRPWKPLTEIATRPRKRPKPVAAASGKENRKIVVKTVLLEKKASEISTWEEAKPDFIPVGEGACRDEDFEPGTQLNELMKLCVGARDESRSDGCSMPADRDEPGYEECEALCCVECPMCGTDISGLTEELWVLHTNDCLDGMNLCVGAGDESRSDGWSMPADRDEPGSEQNELSCRVECPICGTDISGHTEELRALHTNDCLDTMGAREICNAAAENSLGLGGDNKYANPVLEWLNGLSLSEYNEVFIKEEIDWETLQSLTEEDLLRIGISALGPRKKMVHAITALQKANGESEDKDSNLLDSARNQRIPPSVGGNKLITEYFKGSNIKTSKTSTKNKQPSDKSQRQSTSGTVTSRKHVRTRKDRDVPPWCCIPGTPFRVDAFNYVRGDCRHWFLTHFHLDHYQGLTKSFCHGMIYCSLTTARLVNLKLGLPWDKIHILPLNKKIIINGISLTCFDANHCPGSIIILFEPPNGKIVLHTGDFRYSSEMLDNPALKSCHVHTLILDTTYCNPQYDFPNQETVIQFVIESIQAEAFNPKTLFLIGSYTIGKERLFMDVARLLQKKVYVGAAKLQMLRCMDLPEEEMKWLTTNEHESQIHVVPLWSLASFKRMKYICDQYAARFDLIVAFSPTGWAFGKGKKKTPCKRLQRGTVIRYEVPYSEHSSFTELRDFVRFISPEYIIPSVNNNSPQSADSMISLLLDDPISF